jgi:hypothetical protein
MEYVTIPGVEIGSVGMEWPAAGGPFTLTSQNLVDVMTAANDDPHIVVPRLKLGHEGWPDNKGMDNNPFADASSAEPAVGRLQNFRLTNDGATLVCDAIDVPAWVAAAYPSRSPEWIGEVDPVVKTGVVTPGGKHYTMVITAVALLGVCWPAQGDIEDLPALEQFLTTGTVGTATAATTTSEEATMTQAAATRADIDTVQRSFWADFAASGTEYMWWWPRDIYVDPNEVLADDDEGHLFRVPFSANADGDIQWGEPVRVRVDLVDLPPLADQAAATSLVASTHRAVMATSAAACRTFATAATARPTDRHTQKAAADVAAAATQAASARPEPQEDKVPDITPDQLQRLRALPEDADQEQIDAAMSGTTVEDDTEVEETTADDTERQLAAATAATTDDDPNQARIDALERELAELRSKEQARETKAAQDEERRRVRLVGIATSAGVITPSEVDRWTTGVKDPAKGDGFVAALTSMIEGKDPSLLKVPTTELGAGAGDDDAAIAATAVADGPLPDNLSILTPAERAQLAR